MLDHGPEPAGSPGEKPPSLRELGRRRFAWTEPTAVSSGAVHKWKTFRHLCLAKSEFSLSDRTLVVLEALLTFHPDTLMTAGTDDLIVFPSNRQLSIRARGMALSTLRRHLAALVDSGLLRRRDSPNGKRFARRNAQDEIAEAFGFDLRPFVTRAGQFERIADEVETRRRRMAGLKGKITIARRDIAKMIAVGVEANILVDWAALHCRLQELSVQPRRAQAPEVLEAALIELGRLETECLAILDAGLSVHRPSPLQAEDDNSLPTEATPGESTAGVILDGGPAGERAPQSSASENVQDNTATPFSPDKVEDGASEAGSSDHPAPKILRVPLALVLSACPDICDYARGGIGTFHDLCAAADLVRTLLGVTPDGWGEARRVLGREGAATVIAAILQRGDAIKNAGGYLRTLTRRAVAGRFSVWPMLIALENARRKASAANGHHPPSTGGSRPTALRCS